VSASPAAALSLPRAGIEVLASVAQHRLLSTGQVHTLHLAAHGRRWAQRVLARLERAGLITHARQAGGALKLWHLTERGADLVHAAGALDERPKLLMPADAAGQLQAHTLAVNDAAIAFVRAARTRGDEFGPFSWRHEVAHPLGRGRGRPRGQLVADALLTYLLVRGEELSLAYRLLELDRATLSVDRLARKLVRYAELYLARDRSGTPLWRTWYPAFPAVLVVLCGGSRTVLERRRDTTITLCQADLRLERASELRIAIGLLEDHQADGPFAPIYLDVRAPERPVNWLGEPTTATSAGDRAGKPS